MKCRRKLFTSRPTRVQDRLLCTGLITEDSVLWEPCEFYSDCLVDQIKRELAAKQSKEKERVAKRRPSRSVKPLLFRKPAGNQSNPAVPDAAVSVDVGAMD